MTTYRATAIVAFENCSNLLWFVEVVIVDEAELDDPEDLLSTDEFVEMLGRKMDEKERQIRATGLLLPTQVSLVSTGAIEIEEVEFDTPADLVYYGDDVDVEQADGFGPV